MTMTLQGLNVDTDRDAQGVLLRDRIEQILGLPEYQGHTIRLHAKLYEAPHPTATGTVGGWIIEHCDCEGCTDEERTAVRTAPGPWGPVGRLDARVTPPTVWIGKGPRG
jgi:hypothetical protein